MCICVYVFPSINIISQYVCASMYLENIMGYSNNLGRQEEELNLRWFEKRHLPPAYPQEG